MKKILIVNEGDSSNLGDRLINHSLNLLFEDSKCKVFWQSYSCYPKQVDKLPYFGGIKIAKNDFLKNFFKRILPVVFLKRIKWYLKNKDTFNKYKKENYDLVIIGGGQLLNNYWLFPFSFFIWTSIFLKTNLITFGIGVGDSFTYLDNFLIGKGLKRCTKIFLRDNDSQVRTLKYFKVESTYIPDPVFMISDFYINEVKKDKAVVLPLSYEHVYLRYNKSNPMSELEYIKFWKDKIEEYSKKNKEVIVSITDLFQDNKIFNQLKELNYSSDISFKLPKGNLDLIDIIKTSKNVCSGRMHALIIGYSYLCNCEVYEVSNKLKTFKEEVICNKKISIEKIKKLMNNQIGIIKKIYYI